jgi:UDP-N-acetylmuramoyl-L-alanyl-D-glutamate--2,6-diaminopimelate ligase
MRLGDLADIGLDSDVTRDVDVTGFALDHRQVAPGNVFGAFKGARFNGEDFIPEAVARGAVAVVAGKGARADGAPLIAAEEPRKTFAEIAARYYAPYPDTIVAVTGTNGKTSTVEMTRQLWRMAGHRSASIGTLGVTTADEQVKTGLTSPDIVTFLSNMAGMRRLGVTHVAYEASSHGLDQYRAEGVPVRAAAFTNLSRDHLDYHSDMDSYFAAKMRLFDEVVASDGTAVVWSDDPKSDGVVRRAKARGLQLITVGEGGNTIQLASRRTTALGQELLLRHDGREHKLTLPLIGSYQVANVLVSAGSSGR